MYYNLFLDDIRNPRDVKWLNLPSVEWTIVRDYDEFVNVIKKQGVPTFIAFDHDLGPDHYNPSMYNKLHETFSERNGYDCAKWLVDYCMNRNLKVPKYAVHSMNPIGKNNIINYIESYKKSSE